MAADKNRSRGADVIPLFDVAVNPVDGFDEWLTATGYEHASAKVMQFVESLLEVIDRTTADFQPTAWRPQDAHVLGSPVRKPLTRQAVLPDSGIGVSIDKVYGTTIFDDLPAVASFAATYLSAVGAVVTGSPDLR